MLMFSFSGYCEADLRLFYCICKKRFSHDTGQISSYKRTASHIKGYNLGWFSGHFFFVLIKCFCFVIAIFDLVFNVEAIHGLC